MPWGLMEPPNNMTFNASITDSPATTSSDPLKMRTCVNKKDGAECRVCFARIWFCGGKCLNEICQGNKENQQKGK